MNSIYNIVLMIYGNLFALVRILYNEIEIQGLNQRYRLLD